MATTFTSSTSNEQGGIEIAGKKHKVNITYYDDESDTNTAVKLVEKLITDGRRRAASSADGDRARRVDPHLHP
jgi:ABC-type branched-subunit amino acid transport system substrate-binding protein